MPPTRFHTLSQQRSLNCSHWLVTPSVVPRSSRRTTGQPDQAQGTRHRVGPINLLKLAARVLYSLQSSPGRLGEIRRGYGISVEFQCDNCKKFSSATTPVWVCKHSHEYVIERVVNGITYFTERGQREIGWCKPCLDAGGFGGETSGEFGEWARCPVCGKHMQRN